MLAVGDVQKGECLLASAVPPGFVQTELGSCFELTWVSPGTVLPADGISFSIPRNQDQPATTTRTQN